jgi:hypothetical protein
MSDMIPPPTPGERPERSGGTVEFEGGNHRISNKEPQNLEGTVFSHLAGKDDGSNPCLGDATDRASGWVSDLRENGRRSLPLSMDRPSFNPRPPSEGGLTRTAHALRLAVKERLRNKTVV